MSSASRARPDPGARARFHRLLTLTGFEKIVLLADSVDEATEKLVE